MTQPRSLLQEQPRRPRTRTMLSLRSLTSPALRNRKRHPNLLSSQHKSPLILHPRLLLKVLLARVRRRQHVLRRGRRRMLRRQSLPRESAVALAAGPSLLEALRVGKIGVEHVLSLRAGPAWMSVLSVAEQCSYGHHHRDKHPKSLRKHSEYDMNRCSRTWKCVWIKNDRRNSG